MIDGPCRAPSSPPETPVPMKSRPFSASDFALRIVSGKCELPAVDDAVPRLEVGKEELDGLVHGFPRLDQEHDLPRPLQARRELGHGVRSPDGGAAVRRVAEELVDHRRRCG